MELLFVLTMVVGHGLLFWHMLRHDRSEQRLLRDATAPINPSIPMVSMHEIRQSPMHWIPKLRGKVASISIVSAPIFTASAEGGNNIIPRFSCFLVDSNGEIHDLAEGRDERPLEQDGDWLAGQLGLELNRRF